jgi:D-alanyl-D-alanine carboxypeptidase
MNLDQCHGHRGPSLPAPGVRLKVFLLAVALVGAPLDATSVANAAIDVQPQVQPQVAAAGVGSITADTLLERLRVQHGLPALAGIVVRTDSLLEIAVTGVRRQDRPAAAGRNDLFHLGSMGKAITATVIARLVEEGRLDWTTRPVDVFPELATSIHPAYRELTVEQLLRHTGGMAYYGTRAAVTQAGRRWSPAGSPREQRRAFSVWLLQQRPHVAPGSRMVYSNAGYAVAGAMAEAAAGESWDSLVETRLARPLGIRLVHGWPALGDSLQPWGHKPKSALFGLAVSANTEPQDPKDGWLGSIFNPAGDYSLSLDDYGVFLQLHLAGLAGRDGLLRAASIQHLHSGPGDYALGWSLREFEGTPAHSHTGVTGAFFSRVTLLPQRGVAIAVVSNSGSVRAETASREAVAVLLQMHGGATSSR